MPVIVRFDPLATLVAAFEALWPEKACELAIAPFSADDEACARLGLSDEPGDPLIVLVNARSSIDQAVEALATVLAHVATAPWAPARGGAFEANHEALRAEFIRRAEQSGAIVLHSGQTPAGTRLQ